MPPVAIRRFRLVVSAYESLAREASRQAAADIGQPIALIAGHCHGQPLPLRADEGC